jgi:DNA-directed RNA polymerase subunit L
MKLNFVEDSGKSLIVEFIDVDRSVAELIKSKLIDNKDVEFVGVVREHPDIDISKLIVKSNKNAKTLVEKALGDIQDDMKELAANLPKK